MTRLRTGCRRAGKSSSARHFLFEPVKAIAEHLGLATNQVTYKLHKAKMTLRDALIKREVTI